MNLAGGSFIPSGCPDHQASPCSKDGALRKCPFLVVIRIVAQIVSPDILILAAQIVYFDPVLLFAVIVNNG